MQAVQRGCLLKDGAVQTIFGLCLEHSKALLFILHAKMVFESVRFIISGESYSSSSQGCKTILNLATWALVYHHNFKFKFIFHIYWQRTKLILNGERWFKTLNHQGTATTATKKLNSKGQ